MSARACLGCGGSQWSSDGACDLNGIFISAGARSGKDNTMWRPRAIATRARVSMRLRAPPPSSRREITDLRRAHARCQLALAESGFGAQVVYPLPSASPLRPKRDAPPPREHASSSRPPSRVLNHAPASRGADELVRK